MAQIERFSPDGLHANHPKLLLEHLDHRVQHVGRHGLRLFGLSHRGVVAGLIASPRWAPSPLPTISRGVVDALLVCGFFAAGIYLSSERRDEQAPFIERPDRVVLTVTAIATRLLLMPLILLGLSLVAVAVPTAYLVQATMPTGLDTLVIGHAYDLDQTRGEYLRYGSLGAPTRQ